MNQELRLYTFCNFYLSSIQQGIQSAHVVHSLFVKYPSFESNSILWDWAQNDKTMIVLNGGAFADINQSFLTTSALNLNHHNVLLPFERFSEDDYSLGGIMTCWGIVLPKRIYDAKYDEATGSYFYTDDQVMPPTRHDYANGTPEFTFIKMLKSCSLAR